VTRSVQDPERSSSGAEILDCGFVAGLVRLELEEGFFKEAEGGREVTVVVGDQGEARCQSQATPSPGLGQEGHACRKWRRAWRTISLVFTPSCSARVVTAARSCGSSRTWTTSAGPSLTPCLRALRWIDRHNVYRTTQIRGRSVAHRPRCRPVRRRGIIAEISVDMSRFPTAGHLASWAGMCPGNHESGGKRHGGRAREGPKWLGALLAETAAVAGRSKGTYLGAQHHRLTGRVGYAKANKAVGHSILVAVWHLLAEGVPYHDLGADWFVKRRPEAHARRFGRQIETFGYTVTITPEPGRLNPPLTRNHSRGFAPSR